MSRSGQVAEAASVSPVPVGDIELVPVGDIEPVPVGDIEPVPVGLVSRNGWMQRGVYG